MGKKLKVILNQDVLNIGEEGDIRDVSAGFARNYLFPKKMAMLCTDHALTILNQKKRKIEKRKEEKKIRAQSMKEEIQKLEIVFTMPAGENGKLFGSITNGHIAEELQRKGFAVERRKIEVPDHHLKMTGEFTVKVKLYGEEEASLKVVIKAQETAHEGKADKREKNIRGERTRQRAKPHQTEGEAVSQESAQSEVGTPQTAGENNAAAEGDASAAEKEHDR